MGVFNLLTFIFWRLTLMLTITATCLTLNFNHTQPLPNVLFYFFPISTWPATTLTCSSFTAFTASIKASFPHSLTARLLPAILVWTWISTAWFPVYFPAQFFSLVKLFFFLSLFAWYFALFWTARLFSTSACFLTLPLHQCLDFESLSKTLLVNKFVCNCNSLPVCVYVYIWVLFHAWC